MTRHFPFLLLTAACASAPAAAPPTIVVGGETRTLAPPAPRTAGEAGLVVPGPAELGDYYVTATDTPMTLTLSNRVWVERDGETVTVDQCATSAQLTAFTWARTASPSLPPAGAAVHPLSFPTVGSSVTVPVSGPAWLAVRLDGTPNALPCLAGVTLAQPLAAGLEFWCRAGGTCADMAVGGGSPQCSGDCQWYTRIRRVP